ncbi:MAG: Arc family DNA-binding protein [Bacteroidales bacterium]|nr:Arc family DNA-binding protein [Bacteroidales bacterium]
MAKEKDSVKSFVFRADPEMMEALERWAADELRSTNAQLQWILREALRKHGRIKSSQP